MYDTKHPSGKAHGGTAIIIKNEIKHHLHSKTENDYLQATTIRLKTQGNSIKLSAIYAPPKFKITIDQWNSFFKELGNKFIVAGDFNAKHPYWGSKTTSPRDKILNSYIMNANLNILTTGEPTYWPSASNKTPDLIDFGILKGLNLMHFKTKSLLDLSSDHSPIIITYQSKPLLYKKSPTLCNGSTNWMIFKETLESKLNCNIPLKTSFQIDNAVNNLTDAIEEAAWASTSQKVTSRDFPTYTSNILHKIKIKARWQKNQTKSNKRLLNKVTKDVKQSLRDYNNAELEKYITSISPHEDTNYSLWKTTKRFKRPIKSIPAIRNTDGSWAKSTEKQAETFAINLEKIFTEVLLNRVIKFLVAPKSCNPFEYLSLNSTLAQ
ncbi:hypothetical protein M0804_014822 [Polistes exclamans]|nr:hypothetical protein M0804_014822 [Polistes exclamans]